MSDIQFTVLIILIVLLSAVPWGILFYLWKRTRLFMTKKMNERGETIAAIQETTTALLNLSKLKKGATIIFEQSTDLQPWITDPTQIDAILSAELLVNIFEGTKSPLHDGAVIIKYGKLAQAGVTITTVSKRKLPREYGTRHRSALGIAEETDAIVVTLSEERQTVTIFQNGNFETLHDLAELRTVITAAFVSDIDQNTKEENK